VFFYSIAGAAVIGAIAMLQACSRDDPDSASGEITQKYQRVHLD